MNCRVVSLDELLPGAVLADNVRDEAGRVLLRSGALMTESSIEALRRRGVESVSVEAAEGIPSPEHLAVERSRLEARLDLVFRQAGEGEANRQLRQAVLEFKLGVE